jgi:hypothetical protein
MEIHNGKPFASFLAIDKKLCDSIDGGEFPRFYDVRMNILEVYKYRRYCGGTSIYVRKPGNKKGRICRFSHLLVPVAALVAG